MLKRLVSGTVTVIPVVINVQALQAWNVVEAEVVGAVEVVGGVEDAGGKELRRTL